MEKIDYEKYLEVLRKRYNYNKKNIYAILKDLSEDEIVMAFADDKIYNYFSVLWKNIPSIRFSEHSITLWQKNLQEILP